MGIRAKDLGEVAFSLPQLPLEILSGGAAAQRRVSVLAVPSSDWSRRLPAAIQTAYRADLVLPADRALKCPTAPAPQKR